MNEMRVYAIMISNNNDLFYLMNKSVANLIKKNHGGAVLGGYDKNQYISCIVFAKMLERNRVASEFRKMGIVFDTRDDGIIEKGYLKEAQNDKQRG